MCQLIYFLKKFHSCQGVWFPHTYYYCFHFCVPEKESLSPANITLIFSNWNQPLQSWMQSHSAWVDTVLCLPELHIIILNNCICFCEKREKNVSFKRNSGSISTRAIHNWQIVKELERHVEGTIQLQSRAWKGSTTQTRKGLMFMAWILHVLTFWNCNCVSQSRWLFTGTVFTVRFLWPCLLMV